MEQFLLELGKLGTGWIVAGYMFKLLITEKDKRVTDSKQTTETVIQPLKNLQTGIDLLNQKLDQLKK